MNKRMLLIISIYIVALLLACLKAEARVDIDFIDKNGKSYVVIETDTKICVTEATEELKKNDVDAIVAKALKGNHCVSNTNK